MELRPYQASLIDRTRASLQAGHRSPLLVAPCGSGKTVMFSHFAKTVSSKHRRTLILAHRDELLDQISDTLKQFSVPHSFIASGRNYDPRPLTHVGSVFSVVRRLKYIPKPDIIIIDEAHHAKAKTWSKIFDAFPKSWRIGVTASPIRLSGESLGDIFDDLIVGPSVQELTALANLCPYKLYIPSTINTDALKSRGGDFARDQLEEVADRSVITGDAIKEYEKYAQGKRAVVFCVSVVHAQHVADSFAARGHSAMSIDGALAKDVRQSIIRKFRDGSIKILTSCDLVSEGFDLPAIECAIMLRPTESLGLWIQQSGRALRPHPDKTHAILLDHAGNTMRHGLPDETREWTLAEESESKTVAEVRIRVCPTCFGANVAGATICVYCKNPFPIKPRVVDEVAGDLVEVDQAQLALKLKYRKEQGQSRDYAALVKLGRMRGYKSPEKWAFAVMRGRDAKKMRSSAHA